MHDFAVQCSFRNHLWFPRLIWEALVPSVVDGHLYAIANPKLVRACAFRLCLQVLQSNVKYFDVHLCCGMCAWGGVRSVATMVAS